MRRSPSDRIDGAMPQRSRCRFAGFARMNAESPAGNLNREIFERIKAALKETPAI
jgi:hypothetical protein